MFNPEDERASCGVGFVVNAKGKRSNRVILSENERTYKAFLFYPYPALFLQIIQEAKTMLERMDHRGACACDENTGDGAGVMTAIPYELYARFAREANVTLPPLGQFATGMIFVQADQTSPSKAMETFQRYAEECGLKVSFADLLY
ncbi:Glutamate synthase [NADH] amyloplastic [Fasciolopsis buskii]|uniref:glutamate synthase (ferredoxin) n=1 Tax=Fasciolopsis buskii TaxID=27845 RepID=A0A8E0VMB9_9TREM|nr:Glutamate synthase [NADH] amyloplastic [Fasciolopsis buski]